MNEAAQGRAAVFLDRDGVLNRAVMRAGKPYPPANADEVEIIPGAAEALQRLRDAGFLLIVVTNQPDIARGTTTLAAVEAINEKLRAALPLDAFEMCIHDDKDGCPCRKPKPGMLTAAGHRFGVAFPRSFMVGDRWRDIEAGLAAGVRTVLVGDGYGERPLPSVDGNVKDIGEASEWILANLK